MLTLEMLPAAQGDCLWIEYGDGDARRRILVDGGTKATYREALRPRIEALPAGERSFELLVVTHVDCDHIEGALDLVRDDALGARFGDVWFNGFEHLVPPDRLGPKQGDLLSDALGARKIPWNQRFGGRAVVVPDQGELPTVTLDGGLTLTLLSPTRERLAALHPVWEKVTGRAGLQAGVEPGPEEGEPGKEGPPDKLGGGIDVVALADRASASDAAPANGSSIALLLQHEGKRVLLAGDAHAKVLIDSIQRLLGDEGGRLRLDAIKLPHHGSRKNVSKKLVQAIETPRYLFSTSGAIHEHPDQEAVARAIVYGPDRPALYFNYRSQFNAMWDDAIRKGRKPRYTTVYPAAGAAGLRLAL
jgi:hypothetical protein